MQPTGRALHLGNYEGALKNWVRLQDEYELFCCIVDWHALTTMAEETASIADDSRQIAIDYLSAGLDPDKCAIFIQSHVKEHAELHLLLSMVTPLGWLERVPTWKEKREQLHIVSPSYGLLGYPVLQAADILLYRPKGVPVGKDQSAHLELTREICRRFNHLYGEVFPEPETILTEVPILPGIDGRKMSKSYDNAIYLIDSEETVNERVRQMFTDPEKIKLKDPGHPERCPVFALHQIYNAEAAPIVERECRGGDRGCVACKRELAEAINRALEPIRQRRAEYEAHPEKVEAILEQGAAKARKVAQETMDLARAAIGLR